MEKYEQEDSFLSPCKILFFNYPGAEGVNGFSQGLLATAAGTLPDFLFLTCKQEDVDEILSFVSHF